MKNDVLLLTCVFEKFIKVSVFEFDINPLYCVSLPGYTREFDLKHIGTNLQTLQDKDMNLLLENTIRGGKGSVMSDRYAKSDDDKRILYIDSNNLYGHSMSQPLPYDEIEFDKNVEFEDLLNTPDDSNIGYFIEVDLTYLDDIKEKTRNFPFPPENKGITQDKYKDYMNKIKPKNYTKAKKFKCDWTDKKNYLVHYGMLKLFVRHGMVVDKLHEISSFKQSKWLEKYKNFNIQKRKRAKMILKNTFKNYSIMLFSANALKKLEIVWK